MTVAPPGPLLGAYAPLDGAYDELVARDGRVRDHWTALAATFDRLGPEELARRAHDTVRSLEQDGVTYNVATADGTERRPWRLDALPLVVPAAEWAVVERGVQQRARLLDAVLTDLYGPRRLLADGLLPPELLFDDPAFLRPCDAVCIPGPRQLFNLAVDLLRDAEGRWFVTSDRTDAPSGAGYAMENRAVMSQVLPRVFRQAGVDRLAPYFRTLRQGLQSVAPPGTDEPRIVVLSTGSRAETSFEHAFVAAQLGFPLVEGSDLTVRNGRVWLRTVDRLRQVDVILRRVDSWFCDPLELRPDSELGVAGLVDVARRGAVTVVNGLGAGVLENAGLAVALPGLARAVLGEDLVLEAAPAWWCGDAASRSHVLAHLSSLVIRPTSRARGRTHFGPELSRAELDDLRRAIERYPHRWVGQELLCGSTAPVLTPHGVASRRAVLRSFAVASDADYAVMTGGLTRVAADDRVHAVSNQLGAISKDTWVLSSAPESLHAFWLDQGPAHEIELDPSAAVSSRAAENLFWLGRYAERAEATVRLLRAANARRVEFEHRPPGPGVEATHVLLRALTSVTTTWPGFVGDGATARLWAPEDELFSLLVDRTRTGTVASSVQRLLDAADAVRDQLSIDTFLVMGALQRELGELAATAARQQAEAGEDTMLEDAVQWALGRALQSFLALAGLGSESMVRDPAWRFLDTGRRVERALQIANLLGATLGEERDGPTDSLVLESVLTAGESIITYRRRYHSRARPDTLLDLLLCAPDNPRSVRFQLDLLVRHLHDLAAARDSNALELARDARTMVDAVSTASLAQADAEGNRPELRAFAMTLRTALHAVADEIDLENFGRVLPHHSVRTPTDTTGRVHHEFAERTS